MTTLLTGSCLVSFGGNTVRIESDHPLIVEAVKTHFKHCTRKTGRIIADYKITTVGDNEFLLSVDGGDLFSKMDKERILFHLMQDLNARLNGASTTHLVLHAAALAHGDKGLILCGKSGSGKSSLAAWLLANGLQYLTDEVITLPTNDVEINGLCRSLVLKRGSAFIWQRWLADKTDTAGFLKFKDGSAWISPTLFHANAVCDSVTPHLLIFPRYLAGAEFSVKPLTAAEALFQLMQSLVNARNFPDYGMAAATQLTRQVSAFSLTYSDIEGATQWIKQRTLAG